MRKMPVKQAIANPVLSIDWWNEEEEKVVEIRLFPKREADFSVLAPLPYGQLMDAVSAALEEEKSDWGSLRFRDAQSILSDELKIAQMMHVAEEMSGINLSGYTGKDVSYEPGEGGNTVTVRLMYPKWGTAR